MKALTSFVQVSSRFRRSINLERDAGHQESLSGYILTPSVRSSVDRFLTALQGPTRERAWTITGPYGSGKSAFAVFLANLLGPSSAETTRAARRLFAKAGGSRTQCLELHSVLITCERAPLDLLLLKALNKSLTEFYGTRRGAKPKVIRRIAEVLERGSGTKVQDCRTSIVVECFVDAAAALQEAAGVGLLLVLDEAGKALEFAARQPERGDIFLLQALAEAAARTEGAPFAVFAILHQAFEQYGHRLGTEQRNEWSKVQGRFSDVAFQESIDQLLHLTSCALEQVAEAPARPRWKSLVDTVAHSVSTVTGWKQSVLADSLDGCWPLHPLTALLLGPVFRGRFAQNERSLFAFLASDEPVGFRDFLKVAPVDQLYTLDRLYDYLIANHANRIFGEEGKAWAEIESALRRLPRTSEEIDTKVLKACGLISIFGGAAGVRASVSTIGCALGDEVGARAALKRLEKASFLVFRRFRDAYGIWEGSDLNVDALVRDGYSRMSPTFSLREVLGRFATSRHTLARRHSFRTGTLRYFEVSFVQAEDLNTRLDLPQNPEADGSILLLLPHSEHEADDVRARLKQPLVFFTQCQSNRPVVVAVPKAFTHLTELAKELYVLEDVLASTPALQTDRIALRELTARVDTIRHLLDNEIDSTFGSEGCDWYTRGGARLSGPTSRQFMAWLSELCDDAYSKAPIIQNELLNRRSLSSAAAKARRNLMEAMVLKRGEAKLAFEGFPPEMSMYLSVLESTQLHRKVAGGWRFAEPPADSSMAGVWEEIADFLNATERERLPLQELYQRLKRPPFGIKDGPIPVLVCAALLSYDAEIALYERGTFVAQLSPSLIERLLRSPEDFQVRLCRISGGRLAVLERLGRALLGGEKKERKTVLEIVRHIIKFVAALPEYVRNTPELSTGAIAVRNALLGARDPAQLLFNELPTACGLPAFEAGARATPQSVDQFFDALRKNLGELEAAYPNLLIRMEQMVSHAFGDTSIGPDFRRELRRRGGNVIPLAAEARLKSFLLRVIDEGLEHQDWIVSLGTHLASKPPSSWALSDEHQFSVQLALMARRFRGIETLALSSTQSDHSLLRVAITKSGSAETERVVGLRAADISKVEDARLKFQRLASEIAASSDSTDVVIAALALATQDLLTEAEQAELRAIGEAS